MGAFAHLLPAEEHHGKECSLHKERQDALYGKRSSENITHKPRIVAEVCAELKLQNDTCGNAHSEIDSKELHPEFCSLLPELIALDNIDGLHNCHYHRQTQGEWDKKPVIASSHRKLQSRPIDQCSFYHSANNFIGCFIIIF